jgi:FlaA1/EpsC-like NDP-sugar epimerase
MMEKHPAQAIKVNVLGTKIVADLAIEHQVERFILISTDKAVNPTNVMGATKRVAELYIRSLAREQASLNGHATRFVTTRFGNVLGSNGSVVPLFKRQIQDGGPVTVTHPEMTRYFMTIPEACQLVLIAGCKGGGGDIFLFDMGKPIKIMDLATKMIQMAGFEPHKEIEVRITGLRPGEKLYEELYSASAQVIPTDNPKILRVLEQNDDSEEFNMMVHDLIMNLHSKKVNSLTMELKGLVPEYRKERKRSLTYARTSEVRQVIRSNGM